MVRYLCPSCEKRWTGRGRPPGGRVRCPRCNKVVYTYAKALKPVRGGTRGTT